MSRCPTCGASLLFSLKAERPLSELYNHWIDGLELEGRSYIYTQHLRQRGKDHIFPFFGKADVRSIRAIHVQQFYHSLLKKKLASKTVKHVLDALRAFLNYLLGLDELEGVPRFPRVAVKPVREKGWLDREGQEKILGFIPVKHQLIFRVLIETGVRMSEVCALRKKDIRDGGVLVRRAFDERGFTKETKTGAEFFRPLSAETFALIFSAAKNKFPDAWLFNQISGSPYSRHLLYEIWSRACAKAGIKIAPSHASRHSKASQKRAALEERMLEELRHELEHSSAKTTLKHYALGKEQKL